MQEICSGHNLFGKLKNVNDRILRSNRFNLNRPYKKSICMSVCECLYDGGCCTVHIRRIFSWLRQIVPVHPQITYNSNKQIISKHKILFICLMFGLLGLQFYSFSLYKRIVWASTYFTSTLSQVFMLGLWIEHTNFRCIEKRAEFHRKRL